MADARKALAALAEALGDHKVADSYRREVAEARKAWEEELLRLRRGGESLSQAQVIFTVNRYFPEAVVINAAGSMPGTS